MDASINREDWLLRASQLLYDELLEKLDPHAHGLQMQVSCGWPSNRALSSKRRRLAECWRPESCADGKTSHIFVSPGLSNAIEVLETLVHELIHVVAGHDAGHKGEFKRIARAVGLEGKLTATHAGNELREKLHYVGLKLGGYPHDALDGSNRPKQSTRLVKLVAISCCNYVVRTTAKWINAEGLCMCPHGKEMQVAD